MRLLRANVMACCFNASVAAGFDLDVRGASYLVCQRRFRFEENSLGMVASLANRIPLAELMTELIPVCLVAVLSLLMLCESSWLVGSARGALP